MRHRPGRPILHSGFDDVALDPGERLPGRLSCAATIRSPQPTIATSDTDFGAESVTSRPGRWRISPSLPRLPRAGARQAGPCCVGLCGGRTSRGPLPAQPGCLPSWGGGGTMAGRSRWRPIGVTDAAYAGRAFGGGGHRPRGNL